MQGIEMPAGVRGDLRKDDELRPMDFTWDVAPNAAGSILLKCGGTQVICCATVEEKVPRWMKEQGVLGGWITAEYSMLPYSTLERKPRDITRGKLDGRSQEIQRLIGRALRASANLEKVGERTIWIDCDVVAADGGTRTTAITGAYLALKMAIQRLLKQELISESPLLHAVAATSVGIFEERVILDLCYVEDKDAEVDMNLVMTDEGRMVEIQASGEESTFSNEQFESMIKMGRAGIKKLFAFQTQAWEGLSSQ
ncbi:MAG: ribonuclease PH [Verrucomicrobiota bacterium]